MSWRQSGCAAGAFVLRTSWKRTCVIRIAYGASARQVLVPLPAHGPETYESPVEFVVAPDRAPVDGDVVDAVDVEPAHVDALDGDVARAA
jgi:hypothetical protein